MKLRITQPYTNYKILLLIVSAIFLLISWINRPVFEIQDVIYKKGLILDQSPQYGRDYGKHHGSWIKLYFKKEKSFYKINDNIYKSLDHEKFKKQLQINDTVSIGLIGNEIFSISKDGQEYINLDKVNKNRTKTVKFGRILSIVSILLLVILKLFEKYKINDNWDIIWIIVMAISTGIILLLN
jgi:hypothetical protein